MIEGLEENERASLVAMSQAQLAGAVMQLILFGCSRSEIVQSIDETLLGFQRGGELARRGYSPRELMRELVDEFVDPDGEE